MESGLRKRPSVITNIENVASRAPAFSETGVLSSFLQSLILIVLLTIFQSVAVNASDYGTTGLIDIPTARMAEDATLTYTTAHQDRSTSASLTYQVLPWVEATFRYRRNNSPEQYDRNFETKIRLWEEGFWLPQAAVGIRDIVGTGRLRAEYFLLSKMIGDFDVTLGLGWGGLSGNDKNKNPFKYLGNRFAVRGDDSPDSATVENAGSIPTDSFFRGDNVGIIGGVAYKLPGFPVRLLVERNPDQYRFEVGKGDEPPNSDISYGLEWAVARGIKVAISRQHDQDWGVRLSMDTSTSSMPPKRIGYVFESVANSKDSGATSTWYRQLLYDMERDGLFLLQGAIDDKGKAAYLIIGNKDYPLWADALSQATALADLHLPPSVEVLNFTLEESGYRVMSVRVKRPSSLLSQEEYNELDLYPELADIKGLDAPEFKTNFVKKKMAFDLGLSTRVQLFDPDEPVRYQFAATAGTTISLPAGFLIRGGYRFNINQNFGDSTRPSDSVLPHVRSDIVRYLDEGKSGLDVLFLEQRNSIGRSFHYRGFAGVLEEMYSGFGGEVLYRPYRSRIGIGASVAWAKQRDYDKGFDHLDYETVTGFVSAYWASPFHNYDIAIHSGKYLAKDVGITMEVRRTFDNGWMIGAWATVTDVSSEEFGEGSFDKGIFLRIPLDGLFGKNTRSAYQTVIRPVQRDGGQRLEGFSGTIWYDQREARFDALSSKKERIRSW